MLYSLKGFNAWFLNLIQLNFFLILLQCCPKQTINGKLPRLIQLKTSNTHTQCLQQCWFSLNCSDWGYLMLTLTHCLLFHYYIMFTYFSYVTIISKSPVSHWYSFLQRYQSRSPFLSLFLFVNSKIQRTSRYTAHTYIFFLSLLHTHSHTHTHTHIHTHTHTHTYTHIHTHTPIRT